MTAASLNPELASLAFLLGTWRGEGRGEYPTITSFRYFEEVAFGSIPGKPFLTYQQRTRSPEGNPLHTEAGYVRPVGTGAAELVIAQPSGIAEIHVGVVAGTTVEFHSVEVALTPTAKSVTSVTRAIRVEGDALTYRLDMAAVGQDLHFHLEATLLRAAT